MEDILLLGAHDRRSAIEAKTVDTTVDSGAAEVVEPPTFAPGHRVKPSPGSRAGARYRTASGLVIANQGESRAATRTEGWYFRDATFQVADMAKPLVSAGRITAQGHRIVLDDGDAAHFQNNRTGSKVKLDNEGYIRMMNVHLVPAKTRCWRVGFHPARRLSPLANVSVSPPEDARPCHISGRTHTASDGQTAPPKYERGSNVLRRRSSRRTSRSKSTCSATCHIGRCAHSAFQEEARARRTGEEERATQCMAPVIGMSCATTQMRSRQPMP